jgi:hypothetical protein
MNREGVLKWLKIFSIGFIILFILEILDLFLFGNMQITLENENIFLTRLLFSSEFTNLSISILYILLVIISFLFLTLSIIILRLSFKTKMETIRLSKMVFMVGLFFLVADFMKLFFIYMLDNTIISIPPSTSYNFIEIIFNFSITPLFVAIMWLYLIVVVATMIISGLIFGGVGLQWFLKLQDDFRKVKK